jgi:BACON domain-containing protein
VKTTAGLFGGARLALLALVAGVLASPLAAQVVPGGRLTVTPLGGFSSSGKAGGPFTPPSTTYTLGNAGDQSLTWSATNSRPWVTVVPAGGTLAPAATTVVTVSINSNANGLPPGTYTSTLTLTNVTGGLGTTSRTVTLTVSAGPPPTIKIDPPPPSVTDTSPLIVRGTASPGAPGFVITLVSWNNENENWSWGGYADGTSPWEASIPLAPGENDISIHAFDGGGGKATVKFTVLYQPPPGARGDGGGGACGATGAEAVLMAACLFLLRRNARHRILC